MAEALAVAASVFAVIQIADRIIGACKSYIEGVQDAPSDLRAIFLEISMLKTIFENLKFLLKNNDEMPLLKRLTLQANPLEGCHRAIMDLEKLLPSDRVQASGVDVSRRQRVKASLVMLPWPFMEGKSKKLLDQLSRYKSTIALAITTDQA